MHELEIPEEDEAGEAIENSKKFVSVARSIVDKFGQHPGEEL
jgi:hypothetical protein